MSTWPILTFHSVDASGSVISVDPREFERQLQGLAAAGWQGRTVSGALESWHRHPEQRCFALSFDDGYRNVAVEALPILRGLGYTATVFAITGRCGGDNDWPGQPDWVPRLPLLNWDDLTDLAAAGWEVASHGRDHMPLTLLSDAAATRDLDCAAEDIARVLGERPALLAYPYGAQDERVRTIARQHHSAAVGVRLQAVRPLDLVDPFELPRVDGYYLGGRDADRMLRGGAGTAYLAMRRWARRLRRPDWNAEAFAEQIAGTST